MVEDLAVAVPAAVGGGAPTGRVVPADLTEDLPLVALLQIQRQVRVALAVTRHEAETAHAVDLHKAQVELRHSRHKHIIRVKMTLSNPTRPQIMPQGERIDLFHKEGWLNLLCCAVPDRLCWCVE